MKKLPFNACDYRCERCLETTECAVFQKLQERSLLHRLDGKDEDDIAVVLDDIRESFRETEEMIKKKARDFGIDIDEIVRETNADDLGDEYQKTEEEPLFKRCREFTMQTHRFLSRVEAASPEQAGEYIDDIAWHHTVVSAKVYRALGWKNEEDIAEDARNSAAVAVKSLTICIMAFDHLASRYPEISEDCRKLSAEAGEIKEQIKRRFMGGPKE